MYLNNKNWRSSTQLMSESDLSITSAATVAASTPQLHEVYWTAAYNEHQLPDFLDGEMDVGLVESHLWVPPLHSILRHPSGRSVSVASLPSELWIEPGRIQLFAKLPKNFLGFVIREVFVSLAKLSESFPTSVFMFVTSPLESLRLIAFRFASGVGGIRTVQLKECSPHPPVGVE